MLFPMLLYAMLVVCAVLAGVMVYRYDLYDREPWWALLLAAVLGGVLMWLAGSAQVRVMSALGTNAGADWNAKMAAAAGVTEETAKLIVVVLIAYCLPRWFNDPMDGLVYGSFAGLGAALEESAALLGWPRGAAVLPAAEVVRIMGHLVMGGIGGFGIGLLRPRRRAWWAAGFCLTFGFAVALHMAWDVVAFSAADAGRMLAWHTWGAMGLMLVGLVVFWGLAAAGAGMSRGVFAEGTE